MQVVAAAKNAVQQLFGHVPAVQAPVNPAPGAANANNPGNPTLGTTQNANTAPNGVIPEGGNKPPEGTQQEPSPLASFKDALQTDPKAAEKAAALNAPVLGELDPAKFAQAAGKIDFTQIVSPEMLSRIKAGGDDGVKALSEALNATSQTVFAQSALTSARIVEGAVKKTKDDVLAQLPELIRKHSVSAHLQTKNPLYNDPAVAPMIADLQQNYLAKNPNATEQQVEAHVSGYLENVAAVFAKKPEPTSTKGKRSEEDWSLFG